MPTPRNDQSELTWFADAACASLGPNVFFPMAHESTSDQTRHGMWGGLAPGERARLARRGRRSVA